ncbi:phosphatidylserine/phosphatidylglycerophosphate/cardiolipin synthase family protein [Bradyrhizobium sp. LHD-71]|uniref:phospholipase D-like domain-containing protein n=1 Tax=Bradyrhizobium sp. LHD-71 TaxID=3072141 RepID=UPI00280FE55C|nr:phosphatidylserine/phosphatidylglycerophosphate/cardiolipin synthase family protein [Bradyrhizobium sp. LHD-71]MDQ8732777.1 phosphatidylserine/phosphatidylglycerophosphate/cardiolipin synthase family protein [Bradyrhizobium sp. LHD-71]
MPPGDYPIPFADAGSYPVRAGNLVHPLIDGEPAFRRICKAVETAQHSVWLTVAWIWDAFRMPDGRGSLFDVLDAAAGRGVDVRVIFYRHTVEGPFPRHMVFQGTPEQRLWLESRGSRLRVRWDSTPVWSFHHQKSWIVDAGYDSEVAFVGGMNLKPSAVSTRGHVCLDGKSQDHDAYAEIAGPCATDVHHNFVQRWNEASERHKDDGLFGHLHTDTLPLPSRLSSPRGAVTAQIQRTIPNGCYADGLWALRDGPFDIAGGEFSVEDQYARAIDAARHAIYIENQAFSSPAMIARLKRALQRGVQVAAVVPAQGEHHMRQFRERPEHQPTFDLIAACGTHKNFTLAGLAGLMPDGSRCDVYVHGKLMLVDDIFATIGSTNFADRSFRSQTELNISFQNAAAVKALRCDLFEEHLAHDTSQLGAADALRLFAATADANARRRAAGDVAWQGLAFKLNPATYAS